MKQYKYTIILAFILLIVIFGVTVLIKSKHACDAKGGVYVRTFSGNGYGCIKEQK